jgi:IS5 family transposase
MGFEGLPLFVKGFNLIFKMSVALHGKQAQEATVLIDTTLQEKNITQPDGF